MNIRTGYDMNIMINDLYQFYDKHGLLVARLDMNTRTGYDMNFHTC